MGLLSKILKSVSGYNALNTVAEQTSGDLKRIAESMPAGLKGAKQQEEAEASNFSPADLREGQRASYLVFWISLGFAVGIPAWVLSGHDWPIYAFPAMLAFLIAVRAGQYNYLIRHGGATKAPYFRRPGQWLPRWPR